MLWWWLALLPQSEKDYSGFKSTGSSKKPFFLEYAYAYACACVGFSSYLPPSKNMQLIAHRYECLSVFIWQSCGSLETCPGVPPQSPQRLLGQAPALPWPLAGKVARIMDGWNIHQYNEVMCYTVHGIFTVWYPRKWKNSLYNSLICWITSLLVTTSCDFCVSGLMISLCFCSPLGWSWTH